MEGTSPVMGAWLLPPPRLPPVPLLLVVLVDDVRLAVLPLSVMPPWPAAWPVGAVMVAVCTSPPRGSHGWGVPLVMVAPPWGAVPTCGVASAGAVRGRPAARSAWAWTNASAGWAPCSRPLASTAAALSLRPRAASKEAQESHMRERESPRRWERRNLNVSRASSPRTAACCLAWPSQMRRKASSRERPARGSSRVACSYRRATGSWAAAPPPPLRTPSSWLSSANQAGAES